MAKVFIYEFLFRGGTHSKPDDDTYHVILAREVETIEGSVTLELSTALTPERAEELGFPLSRIVTELNQSAVNQAVKAAHEREEAARERRETEEMLAEGRVATAPEVKVEPSLLNKLTFGLLDKPK